MKSEFIQTIDNIETKKKITIYELLGLIKDGKAPKKFLYKGKIYYLANNDDEYYDKPKGYGGNAFKWNLVIFEGLNDEVEIIEDEFIDIEEFTEHKIINTRDILELEMYINKINADYNYKINNLIKNQKKIIERLDK